MGEVNLLKTEEDDVVDRFTDLVLKAYSRKPRTIQFIDLPLLASYNWYHVDHV